MGPDQASKCDELRVKILYRVRSLFKSSMKKTLCTSNFEQIVV